jgi:hypothetical protein
MAEILRPAPRMLPGILAATTLLAVAGVMAATLGPPSSRATAATAPATPVAEPTPSPAPSPSGWPAEDAVTFHSRPDLRAPRMSIDARPGADADLLFITPRYGGHGVGAAGGR